MTRLVLALAALLAFVPGAAAQTPVVVEYYHVDAVGSVRAVTSESGATIRTHGYTPFGHGDGTSPGNPTARFTGKERDAETGFDYFGARYYGSRIGRFTTVDPALDIEQALVDPQRWNRYAYALNNPLRFVDPDGRQALDANVQKMLELLKTPRTLAGAFRGPLIQTVTDLTVGSLLGELFGYPPRVARGGLNTDEFQQLMAVSSYEKGATMLGVGEGNAPALDAVDLTHGVGVSLKSASNEGKVIDRVKEAVQSTVKHGYYNVNVYVHAKSVAVNSIDTSRLQRYLSQRTPKIVVFAKDGEIIELNWEGK